MSPKIKQYSEDEIIEQLEFSNFHINDFYLEETYSGRHTICAKLPTGQSYDILLEDDDLYNQAISFLKSRNVPIVPWKD